MLLSLLLLLPKVVSFVIKLYFFHESKCFTGLVGLGVIQKRIMKPKPNEESPTADMSGEEGLLGVKSRKVNHQNQSSFLGSVWQIGSSHGQSVKSISILTIDFGD